jgi:hypothetical protein
MCEFLDQLIPRGRLMEGGAVDPAALRGAGFLIWNPGVALALLA